MLENQKKKEKGELSKREINLLNSAAGSIMACIVVTLTAVYVKSDDIKEILEFVSQICSIFLVFNIAECINYLFLEEDSEIEEEKSLLEKWQEFVDDLIDHNT